MASKPLNDDADRQTIGEPEATPEAAAAAVVAEDRVAELIGSAAVTIRYRDGSFSLGVIAPGYEAAS